MPLFIFLLILPPLLSQAKILDYAAMVKSVDPSALVVGPEEWGWGG